MRLNSFLFFCLILGALLFVISPSSVRCDEEVDVEVGDAAGSAGGAASEGATGEEDHEETKEEEPEVIRALVPSPDVSTFVHFPRFPDRRFVQGEEVTVLIGLANSGDKSYNLTYVGAALHSPYDYSYYIQNFTVRGLANTLPPHSEITVEYKFQPDLNLEPLDFHLSGFIGYNGTDDEPFRSTFVNGTVTLTERPSDVDARKLFTYVCIFSAVGLIAYIFININSKGKKSRRETGTRNNNAIADWDVQIHKQAEKSRVFKSKVPKKPASKKSS